MVNSGLGIRAETGIYIPILQRIMRIGPLPLEERTRILTVSLTMVVAVKVD